MSEGSQEKNSCIVQVVPKEECAAALALVFDWESASVRDERIAHCVQHADVTGESFRHLLEARRNGQRVGAAWGQASPGRVVNVWPATLVEGEPARTADLLQRQLEGCVDAEDSSGAQSLLPIQARKQAALLLRHGYALTAQLLFLACDPHQSGDELLATNKNLTFEPYRPDQRARLTQLIDTTYVATQDVPALNGLRSTSDVIDGYERTGTFAPELWMFVRDQDRDIGCLLLTDHPQTNQCELIYMGLIPAARGRSWGEQITHHALALARRANRQTLLLGVDAANYPAIVTYARCGFHEVERRIVFCRPSRRGRTS